MPYLSRKISSAEEFHAIFSQWGGRFEQLSRGHLSGSLDLYVGQQVRAFQAHTSLSVLTRGEDAAPVVTLIPITGKNTNSIWQGRKLNVGEMIIKGPEVGYFNRTAHDSTMQALQLPISLLQEATEIFSGDTPIENLRTWSAINTQSSHFEAFNNSLNRLLFHLNEQPDMHVSESQLLEEACLRNLADIIGKPDTAGSMDFRDRNLLVHGVIDYLYERRQYAVRAMDICRDFNVSDRTLRRAFKMTLGMGPLTYFRIMRMHAVRDSIIHNMNNQSLTQIYQYWGFNRLGAFASDYKELFGENPRQTMQKTG